MGQGGTMRGERNVRDCMVIVMDPQRGRYFESMVSLAAGCSEEQVAAFGKDVAWMAGEGWRQLESQRESVRVPAEASPPAEELE